MAEKANVVVAHSEVDSDYDIPTPAQGVVHLKLLHAIHTLRTSVSNTDGLYGLHDSDVTDVLAKRVHDPFSAAFLEQQTTNLLETIKAKRWSIFVVAAAERFSVWWEALKQRHGTQELLTAHMREKSFEDCTRPQTKRIITSQQDLPPLDVLMVWHSFMLNPQCFLEDCLRQGLMSLWHNGMPWAAVDLSIDATTGSYEPGKAAEAAFCSLTRLSWTGREDAAEARVNCPNAACLAPLRVPLTTISRDNVVQWVAGAAARGVHNLTDNGWASPTFSNVCYKCGRVADLDKLKAARFAKDLTSLKEKGKDKNDFSQLMPGTILNGDNAVKSLTIAEDERYVANQLMRASLKKYKGKIQDISSLSEMPSMIKSRQHATAPSLVTFMFKSKDRMIGKVIGTWILPGRIQARYSDSSSAFALDLAGAVHRQGDFIDKMETIGWLQSPDPTGTVASLLQKYERFFYILRLQEGAVIVPTVDIDLGWHTHQLHPASYYAYSMRMCKGRFVDHDDKVDRRQLSRGFGSTTMIYERLFGEPYRACACMQCKSAAGAFSRAGNTSSSRRPVNPSPMHANDPEYTRLINNPYFIPMPFYTGQEHGSSHPSCGGSAGGDLGHHGGGGGGCGGGFGGGCGGGNGGGCGGSGGGCGGGGGGGCGGGGDSGGGGGGGGSN